MSRPSSRPTGSRGRVAERERLDTGLAGLLALARYLGVAADGEALRHRFGRSAAPLSPPELVRAARHLGLRARTVRRRWARLAAAPLPAMALRADGGWLVVARADRERALVQEPGAPAVAVWSRERFEAAWTGTVLLCARRGAARSGDRRFGLRWFLPFVVKYRRQLAQVLAASVLLQVLGLVTPLFTQVVIDKVLVHRGLQTLDVLAAGMLGLLVFEALLGGLRAYLFSHTAARIDVELGARLVRHLLALPLSYFEARRVGDSVARVRELEGIRHFLTGSPITAAVDALFTGIFVAVLFLYSVPLAALALGALPGYVLLSLAVTPLLRDRLDEKFRRGADSQAFLVECVRGVETVKAMAVEPQMERRWEEHLAGYARAGFRAAQAGQVAGELASLLSRVTALAILWWGARLVMEGALTVGELIAFNMLAARVSGPVLRLVQCWQEFQQAAVSVARLGDVLDTPRETPRLAGFGRPPGVAGRLVFEEVSFRYRAGGPDVLRGVSFSIHPGEVVGIVGPSGSGKSTLAKLLQRLHAPASGRVLLDGMDLGQLDPVWLRRRVAVVPQETVLFGGSVRENIALGDPGLPLERVVAAARLAGAHDFIAALPEGYDTAVGDHGCALSGGQRQRIAIARALCADPAVLIFDEATSALDHEAERAIRRRLPDICRGRTVLVIAHRLTMMERVDRVLVIEGGRVAEEGTPAALGGAGGFFARLCEDQGRGRPVGAAVRSGDP
ncbi:MAG: type I secretion system permease/ATPase [Candidatus Rokubacteria bacterium]|nr:type I secretion system permease/ATPase [Candidatus Rokubacteria bacterium]